MVAKIGTNANCITFLTNASGILFYCRVNSSFRCYTLGPLCLWQCFYFLFVCWCTIGKLDDTVTKILLFIWRTFLDAIAFLPLRVEIWTHLLQKKSSLIWSLSENQHWISFQVLRPNRFGEKTGEGELTNLSSGQVGDNRLQFNVLCSGNKKIIGCRGSLMFFSDQTGLWCSCSRSQNRVPPHLN